MAGRGFLREAMMLPSVREVVDVVVRYRFEKETADAAILADRRRVVEACLKILEEPFVVERCQIGNAVGQSTMVRTRKQAIAAIRALDVS